MTPYVVPRRPVRWGRVVLVMVGLGSALAIVGCITPFRALPNAEQSATRRNAVDYIHHEIHRGTDRPEPGHQDASPWSSRLQHVDFQPMDFLHANQPTDLTGVLLNGTDLSDALLRLADFTSALPWFANLTYADLELQGLADRFARQCDLRHGHLRDADLSHADLREWDLKSMDLAGAVLSGANLRGADLRGANPRAVNFTDANLSRADLSCVDLTRAVLSRADLRHANLQGANLAGRGIACMHSPAEHLCCGGVEDVERTNP